MAEQTQGAEGINSTSMSYGPCKIKKLQKMLDTAKAVRLQKIFWQEY